LLCELRGQGGWLFTLSPEAGRERFAAILCIEFEMRSKFFDDIDLPIEYLLRYEIALSPRHGPPGRGRLEARSPDSHDVAKS